MNKRVRALTNAAAFLCLAASCLFAFGAAGETRAARRVFGRPGGQAAEADAAALYQKHCATCHGKDGRAKTFKGKLRGARDLTKPEWHAEVTDERIFNSVMQGRGKMPAFKKKLTDAQANSLVAHLRGLKK